MGKGAFSSKIYWKHSDKTTMLSLDKLIESRRSIRKYRAEKPPWYLLEDMLNCAAQAPSPSNSQPVRFIGIKSEEVRRLLASEMLTGKNAFLETLEKKGKSKKVRNRINAYYRFSEFMFNAPHLFAVGTKGFDSLSDKLVEAELLAENTKQNTDLDLSTGLSLKAFILKGVEHGIGTCILTAPLVYIRNVDALINKDIRVNCFVTAGFPDETPKPVPKKKVSEIYMEV